MTDPTPTPEPPTDTFLLSPAEATAKLAELEAAYRGPAPPENPTNATEAAAKLAALENDEAWRSKFLGGDLAAARQREALQKLVGDEQLQPSGFIEVVDAVSDRMAVSKTGYETLLDAVRESGLPPNAESYMRDLDAGRVDGGTRPTQGEGEACKLALERLFKDPEFGKRYLSGDLNATNLVNTLNRVVSYSAADGLPVTEGMREALARLGL